MLRGSILQYFGPALSYLEHSAILWTCIKLPPVFKTFILSIFEWLLKTGLTVCTCMRNWKDFMLSWVEYVKKEVLKTWGLPYMYIGFSTEMMYDWQGETGQWKGVQEFYSMTFSSFIELNAAFKVSSLKYTSRDVYQDGLKRACQGCAIRKLAFWHMQKQRRKSALR